MSETWQRLNEAIIALEDALENNDDVTVRLTQEQRQALLDVAYRASARPLRLTGKPSAIHHGKGHATRD